MLMRIRCSVHLTMSWRLAIIQSLKKTGNLFEKHQLPINANRTVFICFWKPSNNAFAKSHSFKVEKKFQFINTCEIFWCLSGSASELSRWSEKQSPQNDNRITTLYAITYCYTIIITQCLSFLLINWHQCILDYNSQKTVELGNWSLYQ